VVFIAQKIKARINTGFFNHVAVERVFCELLSTDNSLLAGKIQGNSSISGRARVPLPEKGRYFTAFSLKFPNFTNREFLGL
jgi:hypothetical protein